MAEHPRLGRLLLSLFGDPSRTKVWEQGARGERAVAAKLDEFAGDHLIALHDRRMLRPDGRPSRANIDHIAITAAFLDPSWGTRTCSCSGAGHERRRTVTVA